MAEGSTPPPHKTLPQDRVEIGVRQPEAAPKAVAAHSRGKSVHWAESSSSHQTVQPTEVQGPVAETQTDSLNTPPASPVAIKSEKKSGKSGFRFSLPFIRKPASSKTESAKTKSPVPPSAAELINLKFRLNDLNIPHRDQTIIIAGASQDAAKMAHWKLVTESIRSGQQTAAPAFTANNPAMEAFLKLALEDTETLEVEQKSLAHHPHAESSRARKNAFVSEIEEEPPSPVTPKSVTRPTPKRAPKVSLNLSEQTIRPKAAPAKRPSLRELEAQLTEKAAQEPEIREPKPQLSERGQQLWEAWYREMPTEKRHPFFAPKNLKTFSPHPENTLPDVAPSGKHPKKDETVIVKKGKKAADQPSRDSYQNAHQKKWLKLLPFLKSNGSRSNSSDSLPTLPETELYPSRPEPSHKGKGKAASAVNPTYGNKMRGKEKMGSVDLSLPFEEAMQKLMDAPQTSQTRPSAKQSSTTLRELMEDRPTSSERQRVLAKMDDRMRQMDEERQADAKGKGIDLNPPTQKTAQKPGFFKAVVSNLCARLPQPSLSGNTTSSERKATLNEIDQWLKQHPPAPLPTNPVEFVAEAPQAVQDLFKRMIQGGGITAPPKPSRSNMERAARKAQQPQTKREGKQPAGQPVMQESAPKVKLDKRKEAEAKLRTLMQASSLRRRAEGSVSDESMSGLPFAFQPSAGFVRGLKLRETPQVSVKPTVKATAEWDKASIATLESSILGGR